MAVSNKTKTRRENQASKANNAVYHIVIKGQYHCTEQGRAITKPYRVTVKMTGKHVAAGALSLFKNDVAPTVMPAKYPDFQGLYTHEVESHTVPEAPELEGQNLALLNRVELLAFLEDEELPIQPELFAKDNDQLRQAIMDCLENEEAFLKAQTMFAESGRAGFKSELADLNPEVGDLILETPPQFKDEDGDGDIDEDDVALTPPPPAKGGRGKKKSPADEI